MRHISRLHIIIGLVSLSFLAACATTEIKSVWSDASYQGGPLLRVFVMSFSKNQTVKRLYEDEFVNQLKERGVQAFPSYSVVPQEKMSDESFIKEKIKELGVDASIVTRLVDTKTIQQYYPPTMVYVPPPYYRGWHGYYWNSYQYMMSPGYTTTEKTVVLETNVYSTQNDQLIWSALSETFVEGSAKSLINSLVNKLVEDMEAKNLLP